MMSETSKMARHRAQATMHPHDIGRAMAQISPVGQTQFWLKRQLSCKEARQR
jgi:hypothetical protein